MVDWLDRWDRLDGKGQRAPVKYAPVRSPGPTPVKQKKTLVSLGRRGKLRCRKRIARGKPGSTGQAGPR